MGTKRSRHDSEIAHALFGPAQGELLAALFSAPEEGYSVNDLIRRIGRGAGAVHRQLVALRNADLIAMRPVGNQRRYHANRQSPVFAELHSLIQKTIGVGAAVGDALMTHADDIALAFIFGSVAAGTARRGSDVDLAVVAKEGRSLSHLDLFDVLAPLDRKLGRSVEAVVFPFDTWNTQRRKRGSFVSRIAGGEKLIVLGDPRVAG